MSIAGRQVVAMFMANCRAGVSGVLRMRALLRQAVQ